MLSAVVRRKQVLKRLVGLKHQSSVKLLCTDESLSCSWSLFITELFKQLMLEPCCAQPRTMDRFIGQQSKSYISIYRLLTLKSNDP